MTQSTFIARYTLPRLPELCGPCFAPVALCLGAGTRAAAAGAAVLELPRLRLTAARRLFPYRAAAAWNGLPRHVTGAASKRRLLRHFER